jgi:hypothetical protein
MATPFTLFAFLRSINGNSGKLLASPVFFRLAGDLFSERFLQCFGGRPGCLKNGQ